MGAIKCHPKCSRALRSHKFKVRFFGLPRFGLALFGMAAVLLLSTEAAQRTTRETSRVKTLLVLGDSLSAGFRLRPEEAWPALVRKRLRAIDANWQVINASVSGSTTDGGLRRLASYLDRKVDIFVVELGINDAFRGVPVQEIENNIQTMVDQVRAKNPEVAVVVVGMQFPIETSDEYVTGFGRIFSKLAAKNHAALVPYLLEGVAGDPALNLDDRIHPNAAGHKILAETMWKTLEPLVRELVRARKPQTAGESSR